MPIREPTGRAGRAGMIIAAFALVGIGQYIAPNTDYLLGVAIGIVAITLIDMAHDE